jgi:polyisoprenoid-binding protein YceI
MGKRVVITLTLVLLLAGLSKAQKWDIDPVHSSVGFTVRHMVVTNVHGRFNDFAGQIDFDGKNVEKGSTVLTVQIASIDTDNENRDKHLKSPDFFDTEKFPTMTFKSKKVIKGEGNEFQLVGDLTIKDVTKEVAFDCEFHGTVVDPQGSTRAGFSAETKINRQNFNIKYNSVLETGGLVVSDEVTINLEIEAIKAKT